MVMRQDASTGELVADPSTPTKLTETLADILHVKVWSPFRIYFNGEAGSVSGVTATGPFDVLPRHRNFISLLTPCELVLQPQDGEVRIRISGGVMQVHKNVVTVFLEV
jgi:F0F1-type ATP synthase epsilon subunit